MTEAINIADQHVENMFFTLLGDAIEALLLLPGLQAPGTKLRYARISVLSSALAIEAAANSCFERVSFPPAVLKKIERTLGTLDKFDMFSVALFQKSKFDRGCLATQRIGDLIDVRNDYVHPKITPRQAVHRDAAKGQISFECGIYDFLKIQKSPRGWSETTAKSVLTAVDEFLTYFFLKHAGMTAAEATAFLVPQTFIDGKRMVSVDLAADIHFIDQARKDLKIPFAFVDNSTARGTH